MVTMTTAFPRSSDPMSHQTTKRMSCFQPKSGVFDPAFVIFSIGYLIINIPDGMIGSIKSDVADSLDVPLTKITEVLGISDYFSMPFR